MSRCVEPDGDRQVRVAGIVDGQRQARRRGALLLLVTMPIAGVAGRDDDHDARPDEAIDFDAQRALAAREPFRLEVVADAQVHAVHEQPPAVAVEPLDVLERRDDAC